MERITYAKQWEEILKSYTTNPRDVHTQPLAKRTALWFYVYVEDGKLCVDRAKNNEPSSNLSKRRMLASEFEKCAIMYDIYQRRKRGEEVSHEATAITVNQVYWYGVFADMGY